MDFYGFAELWENADVSLKIDLQIQPVTEWRRK
jgi:hypothetical protein